LLATGYQSELFDAALNAEGAKADLGKPGCYEVTIAKTICRVRIVATTQEATTAERLLACKPWLEHFERFALTYSDTLSDADLGEEMRFHKGQKLVATLIAIKYPVRFRVLGIRQGEVVVRALASRPVIEAAAINGGYYIFTSGLWGGAYGIDKLTTLETLPLELLASAGQLAAFEHNGRWQNCDAERDLDELRKLTQYLEAMVMPID
jgi:glucose-1-phosphate cytidylyltransferase